MKNKSMNIPFVYKKILKCDCGNNFEIITDQILCNRCQSNYPLANTYVNFFDDESKRPYWSMHMQNEFINHGIRLNMSTRYDSNKVFYKDNIVAQIFFENIINSGQVIIDLASGPSGYFSSLLNKLVNNQVFIITDGSPMIIDAHKSANLDNNQIGYLDLDLDKNLPFMNESIDCFTGRFLDNIMEQEQLIVEMYRCLKFGGQYSVMEMFFEDNSDTSNLLIERQVLTATKDGYIEFCTSLGFKLEYSGIAESYIGKIDESDELPYTETDKSNVFALTFIK